MYDGRKGGVVESERQHSNGGNTSREAVQELLLGDVENIGTEDVALVEDLHDGHTVREWRNVQHIEQCRLGRADTGTSSDDLDVGDNFNRTTGDLGRDTEGLEEGCLSGFHTGVSSRDRDILGRESTSTGGSSDLVGSDGVTDILEIARAKDETNVAADVGQETLKMGVLREDGTESTANHSVLAHHDDTLATEGDTNLVHLVRTDVVDIDDEDGGWRMQL